MLLCIISLGNRKEEGTNGKENRIKQETEGTAACNFNARKSNQGETEIGKVHGSQVISSPNGTFLTTVIKTKKLFKR